MFTIGDFARHGRVSVRMLRHYDAIGLLRPARVDPASGYRFYRGRPARPAQPRRRAEGSRLHAEAGPGDPRRPGQRRRAARHVAAAPGRARGADRGRTRPGCAGSRRGSGSIEREGHMATDDVMIKPFRPSGSPSCPAWPRATRRRTIGPVIRPLYPELDGPARRGRRPPTGPGIAYYEDVRRRRAVTVHAGVQVAAEPRPEPRLRRRGPAGDRVGGDDRPPRPDGRRGGEHPGAGPLDRRQRLPHGRVRPGVLPRLRPGRHRERRDRDPVPIFKE